MKHALVRTLAAAALAITGLATQAAEVTLNNWAFGSGGTVDTNLYHGPAGGFAGALSGSGGFDTASFVTYCIELEEHFWFGSAPMAGYSVVSGASYFAARRGNADIAERLGRLMTFVADTPSMVSNAAGSTALQLAIWNTVYDTDASVSRAGSFQDASSNRLAADVLLVNASRVATSRFDVYALEKSGSQDFLLVSARPTTPRLDVPEPGSLALVLAAVAAIAGVAVLRRRGRET